MFKSMFIHVDVKGTPSSIPVDKIDRIELMDNGKAAIISAKSRIPTKMTVEEVEDLIMFNKFGHLGIQRP